MTADPRVPVADDTDPVRAVEPAGIPAELVDLSTLFVDVLGVRDDLDRPEARALFELAPDCAFEDLYEEVPAFATEAQGDEHDPT